jgi:hypothetical protein
LVLLPLSLVFCIYALNIFCGMPIAWKRAFPDDGKALVDNRIYVSHVDTWEKQRVQEQPKEDKAGCQQLRIEVAT